MWILGQKFHLHLHQSTILVNVIHSNCKISMHKLLKQHWNQKKRKKNTFSTTPWFDKECLDLKRSITETGKKLQEHKGDDNLRTELFTQKKLLKNVLKVSNSCFESIQLFDEKSEILLLFYQINGAHENGKYNQHASTRVHDGNRNS